MSVIDVKTADFETEVLKSDKTVLVDFGLFGVVLAEC